MHGQREPGANGTLCSVSKFILGFGAWLRVLGKAWIAGHVLLDRKWCIGGKLVSVKGKR